MNPIELIDAYYPEDNERKHILLVHSRLVAEKALRIADGHLGADLMRREGYPRHALVCERHTGAGLSLDDIIAQNLPVPHRDMLPVSMEEQVICFADKFYSKTHLEREKTVEKARKSISNFGNVGLERFDHWCEQFL